MEGNGMLADLPSERELEILRRLSMGSSDQQIATELYLSLNTVKWHNRRLYDKLGVKNRTQAVAAAQSLGLLGRETVSKTLTLGSSLPLHNLPSHVTSFIGRDREKATVKQLLEQSRLLTITGIGGSGKTRL